MPPAEDTRIEERPWLDLSALGLQLRLATVPSGREYQVIMATPERRGSSGPEGKAALDLLNIDFRSIESSLDGTRHYVRALVSLEFGPRGVDDIMRALPGSRAIPFDPEAHRITPAVGVDPNEPGSVLARLAAKLARHAARHGLDAEAALREAVERLGEPGTAPPAPPGP